MKFREQVVKYDIDKHGSTYVDYSAPIYICPECSSAEVQLKKGCNTTYKCPDCGCEFRPHQVYEITKAGKVMHVILAVLIILCVIGVIAGLIVPVVFMLHQEKVLGRELARELYSTKCIIAVFVVPIISLIFGSFFSTKYENV